MSAQSWRSQLVPRDFLEPPQGENLLENQQRPSGRNRKPILNGTDFLEPDAQVAQLGGVDDFGVEVFPNCPKFSNAEWDLSTAQGHVDPETVVRLVRGKPPTDQDLVRYIKVGDLHPRHLATYKTPRDDFEEHCSIVVDTRFCDPRTDEARQHWEAPETKECLDNAAVEVVKCI